MKKEIAEKKIGKFIKKLLKKESFSFVFDLKKKFPEIGIYFVGGAVRDVLLSREASDFDFVVTNITEKELEMFLRKKGKLVFVGKQFGVYKFTPKNCKITFDIAFPRTEYSTGPEYRSFKIKSDPKLPITEDLKRRDFTMNALAFSLGEDVIVDICGGLLDISGKKVRTVGLAKDRFKEDYTRMLRAIRQAVELGFKIEKKTFEAISKEAPKLIRKEKAIVPLEMISEEFLKSFSVDPVRTIKLYDQTGLLKTIFPELWACKGLRQPKNYHPEIFLDRHNLKVLSQAQKEDSLRLKLAALFHDIGKVSTKKIQVVRGLRQTTFYNHEEEGAKLFMKIARRLRFPQKMSKDVYFLIRYHLFLWHGDYKQMKMTTLSRIFLKDIDLGDDLLKLHVFDVSRKDQGRKKDLLYLKKAKNYIDKLKKEALNKNNEVELPISGKDIMEYFSQDEGPLIGEYLIKAREYYLEKAILKKKPGREEIIDYLKKNPP